jgi:hypothetical protein
MPKTRKRKQPRREPKAAKDDGALSGWTVEAKPLEAVRLRPISPTLWGDSLRQLRNDFLFARKEHGPSRCPLFQDSTSKADAQAPPFDMHAGGVGFHVTGYHDFRWHVTRDRQPIYLKHPLVDADGKPIVDAQGRGLMCDMPARRQWSYCGTFPAGAQFVELAERAGRALLSSPEQTIVWIPPDTLFARKDEDRWVWSIFDLAWQGRHPSLRAERKTWFRPPKPIPDVASEVVYVPYDLHQLRSMREYGAALVRQIPEEWTERLPGYFISELPDVFQASADLIDTLLDMAAQTEREAQQAQPSSEAARSTTRGSSSVAAIMDLRPIHWDILKLIRTLCYEGLPETRLGLVDPNDRRLPLWEPNPYNTRFVLPSGIPEPLVRACLFAVPFDEPEQRWGKDGHSLDPVLQYLIDRGLLEVSYDNRPICAAFRNYFNDSEILATIRKEENENGRLYVWDTPHSELSVLQEQNGPLVTPGRYPVFKLTERAHQLLDAEATAAAPAKQDVGERVDEPKTGPGPAEQAPPGAESKDDVARTVGSNDPTKPDAIGYVASPSDQSSYVPMATIRAEYCKDLAVTSIKELTNILEDFPTNRVRWTRPLSKKTGKPHPQRRSVHLVDRETYVSRSKHGSPGTTEDGFPDLPVAEIEARKAEARRDRRLGK